MARKNAEKVLAAFSEGKPCNGKTISTDGQRIYSYAMLIAERRDDGVWVRPYDEAPSATTRSHISACEGEFPPCLSQLVERAVAGEKIEPWRLQRLSAEDQVEFNKRVHAVTS